MVYAPGPMMNAPDGLDVAVLVPWVWLAAGVVLLVIRVSRLWRRGGRRS